MRRCQRRRSAVTGTTLLAWSAFNENATDCYHQIQLRIRSRSGKLGPIKTLTPCGPEIDWPVAAIDDKGDGVVAWIRNDDEAVEARRVSSTGRLGRLLTVTPKADGATTVAIAMSPTGEALAAWVGQQNTGSTQVQARYIAANGALGPVRTIGNSQFATPSVVISRTCRWDGCVGRQELPPRRREAPYTAARVQAPDHHVHCCQHHLRRPGHFG